MGLLFDNSNFLKMKKMKNLTESISHACTIQAALLQVFFSERTWPLPTK